MNAADAARLLHLRDHLEGEGRLPRRLRPEYLDYPPPGQTSDAEGDVQRDRAGRHHRDVLDGPLAQLHDRAFPEELLDLRHRHVYCLSLIPLLLLHPAAFFPHRSSPPSFLFQIGA